jgi:tetratricopeptide (TPR) repeat protein
MISIDSCIIIKNEMPYILELIEQLSRFSRVVHITDTGSTDGFLDEVNVHSLPDNVELTHFKWINDFSAARNYNFDRAYTMPNPPDMIFWCDGDDMLDEGLVQKLQEFRNKNLDEVPNLIDIPYQYWMERDMVYNRMRLFKTFLNLHWFDAIHEWLNFNLPDAVQYFGDLAIRHKHKKPHGSRNFEIYHQLEMDRFQFGGREFYYYAQELFNEHYFVCAYLMAIQCIRCESAWEIDRCNALNLLYTLQNERTNIKDLPNPDDLAFELYKKGVIRADVLCHLGDYYMARNNYKQALVYFQAALYAPPLNDTDKFLLDESKCNIYPALQSCVCYWNVGDKEGAKRCNDLVLKFDPENGSGLYNKQLLG